MVNQIPILEFIIPILVLAYPTLFSYTTMDYCNPSIVVCHSDIGICIPNSVILQWLSDSNIGVRHSNIGTCIPNIIFIYNNGLL